MDQQQIQQHTHITLEKWITFLQIIVYTHYTHFEKRSIWNVCDLCRILHISYGANEYPEGMGHILRKGTVKMRRKKTKQTKNHLFLVGGALFFSTNVVSWCSDIHTCIALSLSFAFFFFFLSFILPHSVPVKSCADCIAIKPFQLNWLFGFYIFHIDLANEPKQTHVHMFVSIFQWDCVFVAALCAFYALCTSHKVYHAYVRFLLYFFCPSRSLLQMLCVHVAISLSLGRIFYAFCQENKKKFVISPIIGNNDFVCFRPRTFVSDRYYF